MGRKLGPEENERMRETLSLCVDYVECIVHYMYERMPISRGRRKEEYPNVYVCNRIPVGGEEKEIALSMFVRKTENACHS